jgi:hypothetical protein
MGSAISATCIVIQIRFTQATLYNQRQTAFILIPMSNHSNCLRHIHHSTIHCHTIITYTIASRAIFSQRPLQSSRQSYTAHTPTLRVFYTPRSQPCRHHRIASPEPFSTSNRILRVLKAYVTTPSTFLINQTTSPRQFLSHVAIKRHSLPSTCAISQGIEEAPLNFPDDTINERRSRGHSRL